MDGSYELPAEVRSLSGYRYASRAQIRGGGTALLLGDDPYTADLVHAELTARGYEVTRVEPQGSQWLVDATGQERYELWVGVPDWKAWRTIRGEGIVWAKGHGQWLDPRRREDDLYDDDRFPAVSRAQAERLAPVFGAELPPADTLIELREQAHARLQRFWNRPTINRTIPNCAAQLAAEQPAPAPDTGPMPVALDEPFPLLRVTDLPEWPGTQHHFLVNHVTLDGQDIRLTARLRSGPLEYVAVTPFCPHEGYQLDAADHDATARAAKLAATHQGYTADTYRDYPVSPTRLTIVADAEDLPWLELTFPSGASFVVAGQPYERFVPAHGPALAVVPGFAPEWVSLLVPPKHALLRTVTARFRRFPGRPAPGPPEYVEL